MKTTTMSVGGLTIRQAVQTLEHTAARLGIEGFPAAPSCERFLAGALMRNPSLFKEVHGLVGAGEFTLPEASSVYRACAALFEANKKLKKSAMSKSLEFNDHQCEIKTESDVDYACETMKQMHYHTRCAREIRTTAIRRNILIAANSILNEIILCEEGGFLNDPAACTECPQGTDASDSGFLTGKFAVDHALGVLTRRASLPHQPAGIKSGFEDLDALTDGFKPGEFVVVAARPGMGKTAFVLGLAVHAAVKQEKSVSILAPNASMDNLALRLLGIQAQMNMLRLSTATITDYEWARIYDAAHQLSVANLYISTPGQLNIADLSAKCASMKNRHSLDIVVLDDIQNLIAGVNPSLGNQSSDNIPSKLKCLALELNVPVVAVSHLCRWTEERTDKRPMLSDLLDTGVLEESADSVLMLYRENHYRRKASSPQMPMEPAEIIIAKNRSGPAQTISISYLADQVRFAPLDAIMSEECENEV